MIVINKYEKSPLAKSKGDFLYKIHKNNSKSLFMNFKKVLDRYTQCVYNIINEIRKGYQL